MAFSKPLYHKGFKRKMLRTFVGAFFWVDLYLPLENRSFLTEFSNVQKLKIAIYKGLVILEEQKYPKIRVVNCRFFKFLRAL